MTKIDLSRLHDKEYRLDNLYRIVDRDGNNIQFTMNPVQRDVFTGLHQRNLILKARQLGMSTFAVLYLLDEALFNFNMSCGIVSYSLEHAQHIFKKIIGHALDYIPNEVRPLGITQRSAREISFNNGSYLRVDTSLRGGAYQLVLVSEFGKTCARSPIKAEEIVTGTLQTVPKNGRIIIESTGEGNEGFYAEMCNSAAIRGNENISALDYKLFFYPWYLEPSYNLTQKITYGIELTDYFDKIESLTNVKILQQQRYWYAHQRTFLGDKIKQEFPSTVSEAFLSSSDAYYFSECIARAYETGRCLHTNLYDALAPLYVAMDIGVNDLTVMIFFQVVHGEIRIIDYYEDNGKGVDFYAKFLLQDKKYLYNTIFLPHDAAHRDGIIVENTYEREFKKLFAHTSTKFHVLKKTDKNLGISQAKIKFERCIFNVTKVKALLDHMNKYRKKWSEATGRYLDEPYHDTHCLVSGTYIETDGGQAAIEHIKIGDKVKTPSGYKKVTNTFNYKTKELVKIETFSSSITCTGYHKVFAKNGLINADALRYNDELITRGDESTWEHYRGMDSNIGFKEFFLSMKPEQLSILMDSNTLLTKRGILEKGARKIVHFRVYKERFGLTIMAKSLKTLKSIILTKIKQIMTSEISCLFPAGSTRDYICALRKEENCQEQRLINAGQKQKPGTPLMREESGIENMEKSPLKRKSLYRRSVKYAQSLMNRLGLSQKDAPIHAEPSIEELQESTIVKGYANSATQNLHATDMQKKGLVLKVVPFQVESEVDVYDLEVEDDHCYYANNILVSNSNYADAFRYVCHAVSHIETVSSMGGSLEKHKSVVESRHKRF